MSRSGPKPTAKNSSPAELPLRLDADALAQAAPPKLARICHIGAIVAAVAIFFALCAATGKAITWPNDHFSDMNVLLSGENFAKHGFARLHYLPVQYIGEIGDHPHYYLHYPPLPNLINGLMQSMGMTQLATMRACMLLVFVGGLFLMYWSLAPKLGPLMALCGMVFAGTSAYAVTHGMSLHTHAYDCLFGGLMLLTFFHALDHGPHSRLMWAACWCVLFTQSLCTYEFIPYAQVFLWVYLLVTRQFRANALALVVMATAPLAGVGLHVLQNIWAVGWQGFIQDSLGVGHFTTESRWTLYAKLPEDIADKSAAMFTFRWQVLLLLGLLCLGLATLRRMPGMKLRPTLALYIASLAAGLTWFIFLPGHAIAHMHTLSQLFLLAYLAVGGLAATAIYWLLSRNVSWPLRAAGLALAIALCVMQGQGFVQNLQRPRTLPNFAIAQALAESGAIPPDCAVFTNTAAEAQVRYFIRRPLWPCPSPDFTLPRDEALLPQHPSNECRKKYFLFFGPADVNLIQYLAANCPGMAMGVPYITNPQRFMVLFDISDLYLPPPLRTQMDPAAQKAQLAGTYTQWVVPTFAARLKEAIEQQMERTIDQLHREAAQNAKAAKSP